MFTEQFREILQKESITAYRIAKDTGISQGLMSEYNKGEKIPTVQNLVKIADYLGCSVDYLLGRTDDPLPLSNIIGGDVTGGTVVQATHHSSVVVHNGGERPLTDEEAELLRLFNAVDVKRRMKLLNLAFTLEEEIKLTKAE